MPLYKTSKSQVAYMVPLLHTPLDATVYFFSLPGLAIVATTGDLRSRYYMTVAGTIKNFYFAYNVTGTLGTTENVVVTLYKNGSAQTPTVTVDFNSATLQVASDTSNSFTVAVGDYIECVQSATTWSTNPTNVRVGWGFQMLDNQ